MIDKNFMSYEDAYALFSEVGDKLDNKANTSDVSTAVQSTASLLKDTIGWIGGNKCKRFLTQTKNGGTFTVDDEGIVSLSGTTSVQTGIYVEQLLKAGTYILDGAPTSGSVLGSYDMLVINMDASGTPTIARDYAAVTTEKKFTLATDTNIRIMCRVPQGALNTTKKFKPMILTEEQYNLNPSYRPYHESVEEEIQDIYKVYSKMGAKNLYRQVAYSTSGTSGIITDNGNGTYTFSGTTLATTYCVINTRNTNLGEKAKVSAGIYKFKCFETTPPDGVSVTLSIKKNASAVTLLDTYRGVDPVVIEITSDDYYQDGAQLQYTFTQSNGKTTSGYTVKPMLYDASITDNAYQPPTFTNLELTEKVQEINSSVSLLDSPAEVGSTGMITIPISDIMQYSDIVVVGYNGSNGGGNRFVAVIPTEIDGQFDVGIPFVVKSSTGVGFIVARIASNVLSLTFLDNANTNITTMYVKKIYGRKR